LAVGCLIGGAAAGCADTCYEVADDMGLNAAEADDYCELVGIVDRADVAWTVRTNLYDCLPALPAETRRDFTTMLREIPEEELGAELEEISVSEDCDQKR
jgi:hypothetical protein